MSVDEPPGDGVETALELVESWVADAGCPGASVAVVDEDGVVETCGFGHREVDTDLPVTGETLYPVGSVTKPITATTVLLLDERGRIDVDDPVPEYVPYFEEVPGGPVTVRQLLSHTSGMPNDDLAFAASELDGMESFRTFLDGTTDRRRTDGDRFCYYNSGYTVLAQLVEAVTDTAFPTYVERELFDPLGMDGSTFDTSVLEGVDADVDSDAHVDADADADVATPHVHEDGDLRRASVSDNAVLGSPLLRGPGGLVTSATDLARFLQAHLTVDDGSSLNGNVCRRARAPVATREHLVDDTELAYGYGWEVDPFGTDTLVSHAGNTGVSSGYAGYLVERGLGIAVGCNAAADPSSVAREALAVLTDRDPDAVDPSRAVEREVARLVGRYETPSGNHHATVRRDDACLAVEFGGDVDSFEVRGLPTGLDSEPYRFTDVDHVESTTDVEFFTERPAVELLFEGMLFRRVADGPTESTE